jgi:hypothetical protein
MKYTIDPERIRAAGLAFSKAVVELTKRIVGGLRSMYRVLDTARVYRHGIEVDVELGQRVAFDLWLEELKPQQVIEQRAVAGRGGA